ncbi:MAG: hypothetical protein JWO85_1543 [Candidatus Eremiobacteraeota bacterium]|nr:hypothetical protein [Candidatus Eremiobacteraeota bacterium]
MERVAVRRASASAPSPKSEHSAPAAPEPLRHAAHHLRDLVVSVDVQTPDRIGGPPLQRATADIDYKIAARPLAHQAGVVVGLGGVGGQTHSEQRTWANVSGTVLAALRAGSTVAMTFSVDEKICHLCSPWFETTLWTQLTTAATVGGATFTLAVTVGGATVAVSGTNTIWPPEIADAPTFDRLKPVERTLRLLGENRDAEGNKLDAEPDAHAAAQIEKLQTAVTTHQRNAEGEEDDDDAARTDVERDNITHGAIRLAYDDAKTAALADCRPRLAFEAGEGEEQDELGAWIDENLSLLDAVRSGRITIDEAGLSKDERRTWLIDLKTRLTDWMIDELEEAFPRRHTEGEFAHGPGTNEATDD